MRWPYSKKKIPKKKEISSIPEETTSSSLTLTELFNIVTDIKLSKSNELIKELDIVLSVVPISTRTSRTKLLRECGKDIYINTYTCQMLVDAKDTICFVTTGNTQIQVNCSSSDINVVLNSRYIDMLNLLCQKSNKMQKQRINQIGKRPMLDVDEYGHVREPKWRMSGLECR
jgi:hypothetical protein